MQGWASNLFRRAAFGVLGYTVLGFRASQFWGFSLWRFGILGFWQGEACCRGSHILLALIAMQQLYLRITTGSGLGVAVLEVVNLGGGGGGGRSGNLSGGGVGIALLLPLFLFSCSRGYPCCCVEPAVTILRPILGIVFVMMAACWLYARNEGMEQLDTTNLIGDCKAATVGIHSSIPR